MARLVPTAGRWIVARALAGIAAELVYVAVLAGLALIIATTAALLR